MGTSDKMLGRPPSVTQQARYSPPGGVTDVRWILSTLFCPTTLVLGGFKRTYSVQPSPPGARALHLAIRLYDRRDHLYSTNPV